MRSSMGWGACVVVLLACGCHNQARKEKEEFAQAARHFSDVEKALAAGDVKAAEASWQASDNILHALRQRHGKGHDADEVEGPVFGGQSCRAWGDQWKREMKAGLARALPTLRRRVADGKLQWLDVRAFITGHADKALDDEWLAAVQDVNAAVGERASQAYAFLCDATAAAEDPCNTVRRALAGRLARPFSDETFLNSEARDLAFGRVEVRVQPDKVRDFQQVSVKGGTVEKSAAVFALAGALRVEVMIKTREAPSNLDGTRVLVVEAPVPDQVGAFDKGEATRRQYAALVTRLEAAIAALPRQVLAE